MFFFLVEYSNLLPQLNAFESLDISSKERHCLDRILSHPIVGKIGDSNDLLIRCLPDETNFSSFFLNCSHFDAGYKANKDISPLQVNFNVGHSSIHFTFVGQPLCDRKLEEKNKTMFSFQTNLIEVLREMKDIMNMDE